jgi:DNA polymerase iota
MIDGHIESTPLPSNPSLSASSSNLVLFPLPPCAWPLLPSDSTGFYYNPQIISGHILQPSSSRSPSLFPLSIIIQNLHLRRTIIATHLASFIRDKIKEKIGLTSSAGVGRNKLLAKLLAGVRKPDGQTCFAPFEAEGVEGVSEEGMIQSFLDGLSIKKIPGFGHKVVQSIDEALTRKGVVMPDTGSWTVHQVRTHLTAKELELLSPSRGTKLYSLLHGKDPDPVKPNGSFPLQIGVEDSFAKQGRCRLGFWMDRLKELVEALLRRLEGELMMPLVPSKGDEGGWLSVLPHKQNLKQDGGKKRWERYPHSIRLLLRFLPSPTNPNQRTTLSKSMSLAAFLLNHERAVQDRAEEWMRKSGEGLFRELLGAKKGEELGLYEVYV